MILSPRKQAVIFDLDGTLVNTLESLAWFANQAMAHFGLPADFPAENFRYYTGEGTRVLFQRLLAEAGLPEEPWLERLLPYYLRIYGQGCLERVRIYPGVPELLSRLRRGGLRLAVLSNKPEEMVQKMIPALFGDGLFEILAGNRPDVPRKPDPQGLKLILEKLGLSADAAVYAGDTATDLRTGRAAGVFTAGVAWGFRQEAELRALHPEALIRRPGQLADLLGLGENQEMVNQR